MSLTPLPRPFGSDSCPFGSLAKLYGLSRIPLCAQRRPLVNRYRPRPWPSRRATSTGSSSTARPARRSRARPASSWSPPPARSSAGPRRQASRTSTGRSRPRTLRSTAPGRERRRTSAAGCAVVLKPDPQTPLSVLRVAELASEVGFPAGTVNIVPGEGPSTGSYLVRHPGVDKVAFTGSTKTGGEIMRLCSDPIKRLTLELGGKSPNLLFADANLDDAIPSSVWSIYYSSGQSCEARSRVLVEASLYDEFVARFADYAKQLRVGDPLDAE